MADNNTLDEPTAAILNEAIAAYETSAQDTKEKHQAYKDSTTNKREKETNIILIMQANGVEEIKTDNNKKWVVKCNNKLVPKTKSRG
jgi:hypothetical protein